MEPDCQEALQCQFLSLKPPMPFARRLLQKHNVRIQAFRQFVREGWKAALYGFAKCHAAELYPAHLQVKCKGDLLFDFLFGEPSAVRGIVSIEHGNE
jgi:hypothetical protein